MPNTHPKCSRATLIVRVLALQLFMAIVLFTSSAASAWWNESWQFRKQITVSLPESLAAGADPGASVVLPVRLHAGNFTFFQDLLQDGADLRFLAEDDRTPLRHRVELLDPTAGLLIAWVEVPVAGNARRAIWLYYGNPRAPSGPDDAIYDADTTLVFQFGEATGLPRDATGYGHHASASRATLGVAGAIGNGASFDGSGGIRLATTPALATTSGALTVAGWVRVDSEAPRALLYKQQQDERRVAVGVDNGKVFIELTDGDRRERLETARALSRGRWQHVVATLGPELLLYVDGVESARAASGGLPLVAGEVYLGGEAASDSAALQLDEIRLARVARPAWWARITALTQAPETTLIAYGEDQSKGAAGKLAEYFAMMGNLFAAVSLDGLVVIVITALMGLASFEVFLSKARALRRIEREDARLLQEFPERLRKDLGRGGAPDVTADDYPSSTLLPVYRAALRELDEIRAATGSTAGAGELRLAAEAFEAIRASIDSAIVEGTNRLNSRLVVMTVAIAGAPFLGLLGTVVGVMITFASIAAAGDVNVNTIAPGIAAAMMATVAGLLVAIPSLFGYNWLATRVAQRTSAMEVFGDRLITRLGLAALAAARAQASRAEGAARAA